MCRQEVLQQLGARMLAMLVHPDQRDSQIVSCADGSFSPLAPTRTFSTERAKGAYAAAAASYWDYARASDQKRKACAGFHFSSRHSQAQHAQQAAVEDARMIPVQLSRLYSCSCCTHSVFLCPSVSPSLEGRQEEKEEKEEKEEEARRPWLPWNLEFFDSAGMVC